MNSNFTLLDAYLSGNAAIPALEVTGTVAAGAFSTTGEIQGGSEVISGFLNTGSLLAASNVSAATGSFSSDVVVYGAMTIGSIGGHVNQTGHRRLRGIVQYGRRVFLQCNAAFGIYDSAYLYCHRAKCCHAHCRGLLSFGYYRYDWRGFG